MVAELTGQNYAPAQHKADADARAQGRSSPWVWIFVIGLVTPLFIQVGPMRLTPYRLALLVAFFPVLFYWLGGRAGRTGSWPTGFRAACACAKGGVMQNTDVDKDDVQKVDAQELSSRLEVGQRKGAEAPGGECGKCGVVPNALGS